MSTVQLASINKHLLRQLSNILSAVVCLKPWSFLVDTAKQDVKLFLIFNYLDETVQRSVWNVSRVNVEEFKEAAVLGIFVHIKVTIVNKHACDSFR